MLTFAERLKKARKRKGLSQVDVFEAIGLSNKALSRYEKGESAPSPDVLQRLVRLYEVSSGYILGLTEDMTAEGMSASDENLVDMHDHKSEAVKLCKFIAKSPSRFHAVANICLTLQNEGFTELFEGEKWVLEKGGKYFVTRNRSSVIAFKVGEGELGGFNIISTHSDSPTFKLKPNCELETAGHYIRLNTEKYGGMICSSWLDRPLSIAGRVTANLNGKIKTRLVDLDKDTLLIPNVAIHMQRNINDGFSFNPQVDTIPLMGSLASKGSLQNLVAEAAGVKPSEIVGADLFLYNRQEGTVWGNDGEFVSAPQLDDLQCTFASLQGFLVGSNPATVSVLCVLDNEEVGSNTKQGADGDFLKTCIKRICKALGVCKAQMMPSSFMVSADNAHAVHPNHPEYADQNNRPFMNEGIVIKHNGNQRYATDAVSEALFKAICRAVGVPTQVYANRSDIAGGSTLGNISSSQLSLNTVDIGLAQLAMHSSYETAGSQDTLYLERAAAEFYRSYIKATKDGEYEIIA